MSLTWILYPLSRKPPEIIHQVVTAFEQAHPRIDSAKYTLKSDDVLATVAPGLEAFGFKVERGKKSEEKISMKSATECGPPNASCLLDRRITHAPVVC